MSPEGWFGSVRSVRNSIARVAFVPARTNRADVAQRWPMPDGRGGVVVFTTKTIQHREKPVRFFARYDDGDWFFGDLETELTQENVVLLHLEHLVAAGGRVVDVPAATTTRNSKQPASG